MVLSPFCSRVLYGSFIYHQVALRARQVLIAAHQPPYERRYNQVEGIFLSSVDPYGNEDCPEHLQVHLLSQAMLLLLLFVLLSLL